MPAHYVLLTFLVTRDGEQGHPMDTVITRIDLAADGQPTIQSEAKLLERIRREVSQKVNPPPVRAREHHPFLGPYVLCRRQLKAGGQCSRGRNSNLHAVDEEG